MPYFSHDDIAQIATPPGTAALGALRLSGPDAFGVLSRATAGLETVLSAGGGRPERGVHDCRARLELAYYPAAMRAEPVGGGGSASAKKSGEFFCAARVFLMPGPGSYTREDVAEIHVPGSPVVLRAALAALVRAGARAAAPGEFTFRAFRNGRLTLAQAEAVETLVKSGTAEERRRALARLGDSEVSRARAWRERAMDLAARLEAALDFADEDAGDDLAAGMAELAAELHREGAGAAGPGGSAESGLPHIALVGLANAGKSSLLNALIGSEAVLVSPVPSTTRDSLRREVEWHGSRFVLSDNPGYHPDGAGGGGRAAAEAFSRLGGEDMACWVIDGSRPPGVREKEFAARLSGRVFLAVNKCDLPMALTPDDWAEWARAGGVDAAGVFAISAATGAGLGELARGLAEAGRGLAGQGNWSGREAFELVRALGHCRAAADELSGAGRLELASDDVRMAVGAFSRMLGEGYGEEALARIFSRFCIGK